MTNKKAIILLCILIPLMSYGISEKDSISKAGKNLPAHAFKVYPLSFFPAFPSVYSSYSVYSLGYFSSTKLYFPKRMNLVSYERKLYKNNTLSVSAGIGVINFISNPNRYEFGGELEYRYYIKDALKGWYVGAMFLYSISFLKLQDLFYPIDSDLNNLIKLNTPDLKVYVNTVSVGPKFGYQFLWKKKKGFFTLDLGSGLGYTHIFYENNIGRISPTNTLGLFFDIGLGYSFYKIKKVK